MRPPGPHRVVLRRRVGAPIESVTAEQTGTKWNKHRRQSGPEPGPQGSQ